LILAKIDNDANRDEVPIDKHIFCPTRGMGEKPSPLGEDFSLMVDVASKGQGFKERLGWSFHLAP